MRQGACGILRTMVFVALAIHLAACGSHSSLTSIAPPGGTPTSANGTAASGPLLGAWWDSSQNGLRPVYGIAGAAYQGAATYSDGSYNGAVTCMRKSVALLTTSSGALFSVNLPQGKPVQIVSNGIPKPWIAFSPSCTSSLVYTPGSSPALLVQALLSTPTITSVMLPAGVSAAIVADSGSVLVETSDADSSAVIQLLAIGTNTLQPVTTLSGFGGMAFLPGVDSALLADATMNNVIVASHLTSNMSLSSIANAADGVAKPTAVAISADGHFAAIVNSNGSNLLRLDLSRQSAPIKTACNDFAPSELVPLAGNFAFQLNAAGSGTIWAFDGNSSKPRVFFIPSDQVARSSKRGGR